MKEVKDLSPGQLEFSLTGFQATHLAEAVEAIKEMKNPSTKVFLSFTANLMASGLRGVVKELCRKKFVDAVITTAGSIDHDVIKCFQPYYLGSFNVDDAELREKGFNRLGNILIPTKGFELFEEKIQPIFREFSEKERIVSPSELTSFVGSKLNEDSFLYWCNKNSIPVYCPGITDGAIGLQLYFFRQKNKDFHVDVTKDMGELAQLVLNAEKTGAIILGGGISKHYTIGSNILRDGLDYAVYFTTAPEYDGSLSGAQHREAKSWGKIKPKAKSVTVVGDATILFPLAVKLLMDKKVL